MISIVSVGIENYPMNNSLATIECAFLDALKFYSVIENNFSGKIKNFNSICLKNLKAVEFTSFIKSLYNSLDKDDLFILFYSGHGEIISNRLYLNFYDSENTNNGKISSREIQEILNSHPARSILILDACHSGAALNIANNDDLLKKSKVSVISSSESYELASYSNAGSKFTNALCQAITELTNIGKQVSIDNIAIKIKNYGLKCLVNVEEGEHDVILFEKEDEKNYDRLFIQNTLIQLEKVNNITKEMLWYSLIELPNYVKVDLLVEYLKLDGNKNEGSWLVRRAIGSFICSINIEFAQKKSLLFPLLRSPNWMEQIIALNALKYDIDEEISKELKKIIGQKESNMNLVWLAHLYLSDSEFSDINVALNSNLSLTKWGIYDIYSRYREKSNDILKILETEIKSNELLANVHIEEKIKEPSLLNLPIDKFYNSKLYRFIEDYSFSRGRIEKKEQGKKWLLSVLYGSWRDQQKIDLKEYLNNTKTDIIKKELKLVSFFPAIEKRMAVLSYFLIDKENFNKYRDSLIWGIKEEHPWVRVLAIRLFNDVEQLKIDCLSVYADSTLYPGILDLILTANELSIDTNLMVNNYNFTENEMKALSI